MKWRVKSYWFGEPFVIEQDQGYGPTTVVFRSLGSFVRHTFNAYRKYGTELKWAN